VPIGVGTPRRFTIGVTAPYQPRVKFGGEGLLGPLTLLPPGTGGDGLQRAMILGAARNSIRSEVNLAKAIFALLLCLLALGEPTLARAGCFRTVSDVKAHNVKTRWQETTANDGKPLIISIIDGAAGLVYSAKKAGVLWLSGNVSVCSAGGATDITLKNTRATSDVPTLARLVLPHTQSAQIVGNQIKLAGQGWDGTFIGQ